MCAPPLTINDLEPLDCSSYALNSVNLTVRVPRGTREEKEVFESVVTSGEMEVGPPEPPCRGEALNHPKLLR